MSHHVFPASSARTFTHAVKAASKASTARLARRTARPICRLSATSVKIKEVAKEVLVPAADLRNGVLLRLVNEGRGQAVEVEYVGEGSAAREIGLKAGQKLRGIEDPMRSNEMYELGDRPSLKFVMDVIMMSRHAEIKLQVEDPLVAEAPPVAQAPPATAPPSSLSTAAAEPLASDLTSTARSLSVIHALDSLTGSTSDSDRVGLTIAEQLEQQLAAMQAEGTAPANVDGEVFLTLVSPSMNAEQLQQQQDANVLNSLAMAQGVNTDDIVPTNDLQARVKRRKEYMDQVEQRNDSPFFTLLFGAFIVPPAIILGLAYASGYMDSLYTNTVAHLH